MIVTDHTSVNYREVVNRSKLVLDTRHALKGIQAPNVIRL